MKKIKKHVMISRENFDISKYLIIGSEDSSLPVEVIVRAAIVEGFTCVQIRSKNSNAREILSILRKSAEEILNAGKENSVALIVNDRLDIVLAAREFGIKVDGIHIGQNDIPLQVCRKFLGNNCIIGLTAQNENLIDCVRSSNILEIDYFGIAPLHQTATKPDCGKVSSGEIVTLSFSEISKIVAVSPRPIVVGGGVKLEDISELVKTGVQGFFVVSAVAAAPNPRLAARELVTTWNKESLNRN